MQLIESRKRVRRKKIPDSLIYEIMDGKPLYYKGYKKVLQKQLNTEGVMGSSTLHALILEYILRILYKADKTNAFRIFSGELGQHLDINNNLSGDILVYGIGMMPIEKISTHYADVPALLQIEIDIHAELEDFKDTAYIKKKTQKLLDFGTQKIIWIFSSTQQVMVAEKNKDWLWIDWNKDIQIWKDEHFNVGEYLKQQGVKVEED